MRRRIMGVIILVIVSLAASGCAYQGDPWLNQHPDGPGFCHGGCPDSEWPVDHVPTYHCADASCTKLVPTSADVPEFGATTADGRRADLIQCPMTHNPTYWCGA